MANSEPTTRRINTESRRKLIEAIRTKADKTSRLYGKLVRWKEEKNPTWHYGIGLSNTYLFYPRLVYPSQIFEVTNEYQYHNIRIVSDSGSTTFSPIDVIERLIQALFAFDEFDEKVYYENPWNNEIFARLIATNKAIHYENRTEAKRYKKVEKEFINYLEIYAPELKPRIVSNKFPKWIINLLFAVLGLFVGVFSSILLWSKAWDNLVKIITSELAGLPNKVPILINIVPTLTNIVPILIIVFIVFMGIVFFLLARFSLSISNVEWSGFRGQKLWDWLDLLIVPIMLAVGAFFLNFSSEQRQSELNRNQQKQESLKSYLSQVKDILIKDSLQAQFRNEQIKSKKFTDDEQFKKFIDDQQNNDKKNIDTPILSFREQKTIEALTQTMLKELDESRKRQVIEFLAKSKLITYPDCDSETADKIDEKTGLPLFYTKLPQISIDKADLKDVNLSNLDLSCVNFSETELSQTNFDNSDLSNANLTNAEIKSGTSFKYTNLIGTNFGTNFFDVRFKDLPENVQKILILASLSNVNSKNKQATQVKLNRNNFDEVYFGGGTFYNIDFRNGTIQKSNLQFTKFINCNLDWVNFTSSDLSKSIIDKNSSAKRAIFSNTNLTGAILENVNLKAAQFNNANLSVATLSGSTLIEASFLKANLFVTQLENSNLQGANFTEANLESTNFKGANLAGANLSNIKSLQGAVFDNACYDKNTQFPANFDPKTYKMEKIDDSYNNPCTRTD